MRTADLIIGSQHLSAFQNIEQPAIISAADKTSLYSLPMKCNAAADYHALIMRSRLPVTLPTPPDDRCLLTTFLV